jgi:hypothetical protein
VLLIALAAAIALIVAPWLVVIGTIIVVLAKWDEISKMFTVTIPQAIDSMIVKVKELPIIGAIFTDAWNTVWAIVQTYLGLITLQIQFALDTIRNTFAFWKAIFSGDWGAAWDALKNQAKAIWDGLSGLFGLALDAFWGVVQSKVQMLKDIGSTIANAIGDGLKAAWNATLGGANLLPDNISFSYPDIKVLGKTVVPGGSVNIPLPDVNIPELAQGGIVTRPTLALIAERGPEAVVPLGQGMGGTFHFYYQPMYSAATPAEADAFGKAVYQVLQRQMGMA